MVIRDLEKRLATKPKHTREELVEIVARVYLVELYKGAHQDFIDKYWRGYKPAASSVLDALIETGALQVKE